MTNTSKILSNELDQVPKSGERYQKELNNPEVHSQIIDAFDNFQYDAEALDFPGLDRDRVYRDVVKYFWLNQYRSKEIFLDEDVVKNLESKIQKGEINIVEEIANAKTAGDNHIFELCISPYTSLETLNMIYDETLKSKGPTRGRILYALAINPNIDPKKFENYFDNPDLRPFLFVLRSTSVEYRWIFYSRPDLTGETIKMIYSNTADWHEQGILIHNKNMPQDLKKNILSEKGRLDGMHRNILGSKPEHLYLNRDKKNFEYLNKYLDK